VSALSAISLLALFLYLRQSTALVAQQQKLKSVVQAERDRLEIEVASRTEELTELTRHLLTAREDERSRLARDLHDELGALLTSAKLDSARIKSRLTQTPVPAAEALERLAHLVETLNSGIALKRRIIEDLRPSALSTLGLEVTLATLASEFAEASNLAVHCALEPVALSPSADLVVYRLVQEAITNISKYARATEVWIRVAPKRAEDGSAWALASVRDNGVGFDKQALTHATHGLTGMRFRVEAEGGSLSIRSTPGNGVLIEMLLPCTAPAVETAADADA
jgi:signal transduction histidine kinase